MKVACWGVELSGKFKVKDARIDELNDIFNPPKITRPSVEFVPEDSFPTASGILVSREKVLDLIVNDLDIIEKLIPQDQEKRDLWEKIKNNLEKEVFIKDMDIFPEAAKNLEGRNLLTLKPIYLLKEGELEDTENLCLRIFSEFGYILFFTCNQKELRAWPLEQGKCALDAAGIIHSDIARGFIKAEVVGFKALKEYRKIGEIKQRGLLRLEDKSYIVQDGDFITFRFNV